MPFLFDPGQTIFACIHLHFRYSIFGSYPFRYTVRNDALSAHQCFVCKELTTGRSILLEMYGREIISSPDILLFGNGMSAQLLKKGTHNLFLEIQYYVGLIGLILYLLYFGILTAQVQKKYAAGNAAARLFSYAPLIVFIAAFCSLQGCFLYPCILCCISLSFPLVLRKMTAQREGGTEIA